MMRKTLRRQLTLLGFVAAVLPIIVLTAAVMASQTEELEDSGGTRPSAETEVGFTVPIAIPATAAVLVVLGVVGVRNWSNRAVTPIENMTAVADEIQAGSLDQRIEFDGAPQEVAALAGSFNRMLDRLQSASQVERQLIEDASHELRTPLSALAARLEVASHRTDPSDQRTDLDRCQVEVERMRATLDALLGSARDRSSLTEQADNDLVAIVHRVVDRHRPLRPEVSIDLDTPAQVLLGIDGPSVDRAVSNLVSNAMLHGAQPIVVSVEEQADAVALSVTDHGDGIGAAELDTIFDRYRGENHGIGLALVKQVADAYGGVTAVSPVVDGKGTRFTMWFARPR